MLTLFATNNPGASDAKKFNRRCFALRAKLGMVFSPPKIILVSFNPQARKAGLEGRGEVL
jgi:hypothetical protein